MSYSCVACNYATDIKSNYSRHLTTLAHIQKINTANSGKNIKSNTIEYKCKCGKIFSHHSSLSRHKKTCKETDTDCMKKDISDLKTMMGTLIEIVTINNKGPVNNTNNNTTNYNISVKSYIQQNYPGAPILYEPNDYSKLTYDNAKLIDILLYKYKHKCLHEYLGDFLVGYYKKDDPAEQSVWSSDISRLTYIVKEALENKESIWNHDYKGIKTKKCIIDPLLQYIKKYITSYWEKNLHLPVKAIIDVDALAKRQEKYNITYAIETEIDNGSLANDIIRYIASFFHMDKNKHALAIGQFIGTNLTTLLK